MWKRILFWLYTFTGIISIGPVSVSAVPECVSTPPSKGYGANGTYQVRTDTLCHGTLKYPVYLYYPDHYPGRCPTVFFCHGIGQIDPLAYYCLIEHIVSRGYALVYAPYKAIPVNSNQKRAYGMMINGFELAVQRHSAIIDTAKIGFVGHSFGGGAVPYISRYCIQEKRWGGQSVFLFIMAPWFCCEITQNQLAAYPKHVKAIVQVYDDDVINDHRMAKDIYENIAIPADFKKYVILYSDSIPGYTLCADHSTPVSADRYGGEPNVLDYKGIYRLFDALAEYTFTGDTAAQRVALRCDDPYQVSSFGEWPDARPIGKIVETKKPFVEHPQNRYINFWKHKINLRNCYLSYYGRKMPYFFNTRITLRNYFYTMKYFLSKKEVEERKIAPVCRADQIESGYGAYGPYFTDCDSAPIPALRSHFVYTFSPRNKETPSPVILFSHAFRWTHPNNYLELIKNLVSRGNVVIFPDFKILDTDSKHRRRYDILLAGFDEALTICDKKIDTTRIGFIGHSYGAGASPAIAWHYLVKKQWGNNGSFLFLMAPWFMYHMSQKQLESFPPGTKLIVQVYDEDYCNDWLISVDIFENMNIFFSEKDFIVLKSDTSAYGVLKADHRTPHGQFNRTGELDMLDYYGIFRLVDALAQYAFYSDTVAKKIALGNNTEKQQFMGLWPDSTPVRQLISTDNPRTLVPDKHFVHSWKSILNKRKKELRKIRKGTK